MKKGLVRIVVLAFAAVAAVPSMAQIITLNNNQSTAVFNFTPGAAIPGLFDWHFGNSPNQAYDQSFHIKIGNNATAPVTSFGPPAINQPTADLVTVQNNTPQGLDIFHRYLLTGGFSSSSDLAEVVTIVNRSQNVISFKFFEYDDFDLLPGFASNTASLVNSSTIQQFSGDGLMSLTVGVTMPPSRWMIGTTVTVPAAIAAGNLTNAASPFGPADIGFAFQWDVSLRPNEAWQMSKDKLLVVVPEPSTFIAFAGLAAIVVLRRKLKKS